jgi:hypothetical protein
MFLSFGCLPNRKHELDEHTLMLIRRKNDIKRHWNNRYQKDSRETLKWLIEQAQHHKRMIIQLETLPDTLNY